jgi:BON domain
MKNRLTVAIASLLVASLGTVAYAQSTPQQMPPTQPSQPTRQTPPSQQTPPATSPYMNGTQSGQTGSMSNNSIGQKVRRALTAHGVTATGVTVTVNNGTATLSGTVYNQRDITKAKEAAMQVAGVTHVDTSGLHARTSQGSPSQG